jgi:GNAT superfamily N-acetyltransferase
VIRAATPLDAPAIAGVQVRAWFRGYSDIIDPVRLAEMTAAEREPVWRDAAARGIEVAVFDQDGVIAGAVATGAARDDDAGPHTGELYALYVDPPAQGAGVGTRLVAHAVDTLQAAGHADAVLWTFAANALGRRFYETRGWHADGEAVQRAGDLAPVVRYRRALG